jgi:hypothetical protein
VGTARGLVDWKVRYGPVRVSSVYSKTKWVQRKLEPRELCAVLDIPADVTRTSTFERQEVLCRLLTVPIKVRSEVLAMMERFFEGAAPAKRQREQDMTLLDEPEPKRGRGDPGPAPRKEVESMVKDLDGGPTIMSRASEAVESAESGIEVLIAPECSVPDVSVPEIDPELIDGDRVRRNAKASKADDASVPEYLWNDRVKMSLKARDLAPDEFLAALEIIRRGALHFWKRCVTVGFYEWWKKELTTARHIGRIPSMRSLNVASKALAHAADASWWDWDRGSAPFFWRWPKEYQEEIRDGLPPRFIGPPPSTMRPQLPPRDASVANKERAKLDKFRR